MPPKRLSPFIAKKIGDWDGAMRFFRDMGWRVKTVTLKSQEEICRKLKKIIVNHIIAQDMQWEPLSPKTMKIKNPKNKDLIYLDTELYIKSITVGRVRDTYWIGIKKGIAYRRKGSFVNVDRVAAMNEFGNMRVPARPLWEPSILELGGAKGIRDYVAKAIYEKLKAQAKGGPVQITKGKITKL